jgi:hypothetical protein
VLQIWGFEVVGGERRYSRHVYFTGPKGTVTKCRMVYDYQCVWFSALRMNEADRYCSCLIFHLELHAALVDRTAAACYLADMPALSVYDHVLRSY